MSLNICLHFSLEEKTKEEDRKKSESLSSVKRPSPGSGEMDSSIATKRSRTHQQNENQQVSC